VKPETQQNVPFDHLTNLITRKEGVSMLVVEIITIFCSSPAKSDLFPKIAEMTKSDSSFGS
jgi:hypothetical protein